MANITLRRGTENAVPSRQVTPSYWGKWEPFQMMEDLLGWDPFREMSPALMQTRQGYSPDFEVAETANAYVFKGDLPGIEESKLDISVNGTRLTISGKREQEQKVEDANYFCFERSYGSFNRAFTLPQGADMEHITADFKNGVLTITVPKSPETQPRKISVGVSAQPGKSAKA